MTRRSTSDELDNITLSTLNGKHVGNNTIEFDIPAGDLYDVTFRAWLQLDLTNLEALRMNNSSFGSCSCIDRYWVTHSKSEFEFFSMTGHQLAVHMLLLNDELKNFRQVSDYIIPVQFIPVYHKTAHPANLCVHVKLQTFKTFDASDLREGISVIPRDLCNIVAQYVPKYPNAMLHVEHFRGSLHIPRDMEIRQYPITIFQKSASDYGDESTITLNFRRLSQLVLIFEDVSSHRFFGESDLEMHPFTSMQQIYSGVETGHRDPNWWLVLDKVVNKIPIPQGAHIYTSTNNVSPSPVYTCEDICRVDLQTPTLAFGNFDQNVTMMRHDISVAVVINWSPQVIGREIRVHMWVSGTNFVIHKL